MYMMCLSMTYVGVRASLKSQRRRTATNAGSSVRDSGHRQPYHQKTHTTQLQPLGIFPLPTTPVQLVGFATKAACNVSDFALRSSQLSAAFAMLIDVPFQEACVEGELPGL